MKNTPANRAARNALLNIFVMPGLGSLLAKRWMAGLGQCALVTAGSVMLFVWLFKVLGAYYDLMFGEAQAKPVGWIGITGGVLFVLAWLWSAVTSISLMNEASRNQMDLPQDSTAPPKLSGLPKN